MKSRRFMSALGGLLLALCSFTVSAQLLGGLGNTLQSVVQVPLIPTGPVVNADAANAIDGQYIVVLHDSAVPLSGLANQLLGLVGGTLLGELPLINAVVMQLDAISAGILAASPLVKYVEQDQWMHASGEQINPTWGLDRVDQRNLPLDGVFRFPDSAGQGVGVYVIDTGVRSGHSDFGGRVAGGRNFVVDGPLGALPIPLLGPVLEGVLGGLLGGEVDPENFEDCNGHGTHVAGTAAGSSFGVAKLADIYGVRVLGCSGGGSNAGVIAGVQWVADNAQLPAVANMSLGGGNSQALDDAVRAAVNQGVVMVVAAGNDNADACSGSPNRVAEAVTVGSTTIDDTRSGFSNRGPCVDIFAPGSDISSAWHTGDTATNTISGTSMAAPHVAGAAALLIAEGVAPEDTFATLLDGATQGVLSAIGNGSPNRLLFVPAAP